MVLLPPRPIPPPKPSQFAILSAVQQRYPIAIADCASDTDSGICADSDQQLSPRRDNNAHYQPVLRKYPIDYLTSKSARDAFQSQNQRYHQKAASNLVVSQHRCSTKPLRVRFADQIETTSIASCSSSPLPQAHFPTVSASSTHPHPYYFEVDQQQFPSDTSYSVADVESLPPPPSYALACARIRQSRPVHRRIPSNRSSASLPRPTCVSSSHFINNTSSTLPSTTGRYRKWAIDDEMRSSPIRTQKRSAHTSDTDDDNVVVIATTEFSGTIPRGRCLLLSPTLPPSNNLYRSSSIADTEQEQQTSRRYPHHRRRPIADDAAVGSRSQSVDRARSNQQQQSADNYCYVRARLIALDHRGYRTVQIDKLPQRRHLPFGFYISAGMMNNRQAIYISRLSLASLAPILAIGDEILAIDAESIEGRSLAHVQRLLAHRQSVTLTLLPTTVQ